MRIFSVSGISKSGKTTTIEEIIKELRRRRYTVGSIKDIHFEAFAIDGPSTNTARHRRAGSELVTAWGWPRQMFSSPPGCPWSNCSASIARTL